MDDDTPIRPAATVVLVRSGRTGPETLLVKRNPGLAFYGGAYVFPGGRVDPADVAASGGDDPFGAEAGRLAAARELTEETRLAIAPDELETWAHWTTSAGNPRRFATWFFIGAASDARMVVVDGGEIHAFDWVTPQIALERCLAKEIELAPPTWLTLRQLTDHASVEEIIELARAAPDHVFEPRTAVLDDGTKVAMYREDAGWATHDPTAVGPRHRLTLPPADFQYERRY